VDAVDLLDVDQAAGSAAQRQAARGDGAQYSLAEVLSHLARDDLGRAKGWTVVRNARWRRLGEVDRKAARRY
jgi:hypothetical protein